MNSYLTKFCLPVQTQFQSSNPEVTCMCLDVIGKYVSWIDINLIANDKFVGVRLDAYLYCRWHLLSMYPYQRILQH